MKTWGLCGIVLAVLVCGMPLVADAASVTALWIDASTNEMGFTVERKAEACAGTGAWAPLASVAANIQTYKDLTVQEGATYCYRVNAWNTADGTPGGVKHFSPWSNMAGITLPFSVPVAPGQLGVTAGP